jgi:phosphotransferase system HPr-like phosphotransfer protein
LCAVRAVSSEMGKKVEITHAGSIHARSAHSIVLCADDREKERETQSCERDLKKER